MRCDSLFCYGTLEFPEVMREVAGRNLPGIAAILKDFARYPVRGEVYPGIVPAPAGEVPGTLRRGIDNRLLRLLDRYEADLYVRRLVEVHLPGGRERAWTYVVPPRKRDRLEPGGWSRELFARRHLARYLRGLRRGSTGLPVPAPDITL